MYGIKKIFNAGIFQGKHRTSHYFEGWYFKLIDQSMGHAVAIIPGISIGNDRRDAHAFIQVLFSEEEAYYFRFDIKEFSYSEDKFAIKIRENYFSGDGIRLALHGGGIHIQGSLKFVNILELPKTLFMPGIMGPYSYLPFMECYHGIINIHHDILGSLTIMGKPVDFTDGYGYIEKDWGRSFPKTWVWLQSNHFGRKDATIMFSSAKIPWLGRTFYGFISFLRIKERIYVFATYTKAKLKKLDYDDQNLTAMIEDRNYRLEINVTNQGGGILLAPREGRMERKISESISALVSVRFMDKKGKIIFYGKGSHAGLEIV